MTVSVLYEDPDILAVDKPRNIHVHPTALSRRERSLQDILEEEHRMRLYPVHRLDRPVSGVLLIAKNPNMAGLLGRFIRNRVGLEKRYRCVVRGWMGDSGVITRPMRQAPGKPEREASTRWRELARAEAPWPDRHFPHSRYAFLECLLETGRHHQIRRHLSWAAHPILGDIAHGDNHRNRIWEMETGIDGLMLQAHSLVFFHPVSGKRIAVNAPPEPRFQKAAQMLGWNRNGGTRTVGGGSPLTQGAEQGT